MSKCDEISIAYKEMFGGYKSPLFFLPGEETCEVAAAAIYEVEGNVRVPKEIKVDEMTVRYEYSTQRTPLTNIAPGNRLLLIRNVEEKWINSYLIPLVQGIIADLQDGKINLKEAAKKIESLSFPRWDKIDSILRINIYQKISDMALNTETGSAISLL